MALVGPLVAMVMVAMLIMTLHRGWPRLAAPNELAQPDAAPQDPLDLPPSVKPTLLTDCITDDYGLLATAAVARTHADALLIKEHLRTAGIRATLANAPDGQIRVLVFGDEVVRARRLVS
jgi:hypothetical protein